MFRSVSIETLRPAWVVVEGKALRRLAARASTGIKMTSLSEVKNLVKSKSDRVTFSTADRFSQGRKVSDVWSNFTRVVLDNMDTEYVQCETCKQVLKHVRGREGSGTGGLKRHVEADGRKEVDRNQPTILKSLGVGNVVPPSKVNAAKRKVARGIATCAALDMRPISIGDGKWKVPYDLFLHLCGFAHP